MSLLDPFRRLHAQMYGFAVHPGVDQNARRDILAEFAAMAWATREVEFRRRECAKPGRHGCWRSPGEEIVPRPAEACNARLAADQNHRNTQVPRLKNSFSSYPTAVVDVRAALKRQTRSVRCSFRRRQTASELRLPDGIDAERVASRPVPSARRPALATWLRHAGKCKLYNHPWQNAGRRPRRWHRLRRQVLLRRAFRILMPPTSSY